MDTSILYNEIQFRTSRSSGSGGQHVNKVETRIELLFDVDASMSLSEKQKERIRNFLRNRINKSGTLIIASDNHRSQLRNKKEVIARFDGLIKKALRKKKRRKPASSFNANPRKRLQAKKRRSEKKMLRGKVDW